MVTVSYTSKNPQFAAAVANAFVQSYMDTTLQRRAGPARQFSTFFQERATSLRQTLDEAKARFLRTSKARTDRQRRPGRARRRAPGSPSSLRSW